MSKRKPQIDIDNVIKKLNEEKKERLESKRKPQNTALTTLAGVVILFVILLIFGILIGTSPQGPPEVVTFKGGDFGQNITDVAFIDHSAIELMLAVLGNLTAHCIPPPGSPVLENAKIGIPRANVNAAWKDIIKYIQGNVTNTTEGCYLYGLFAAEIRTGNEIGPVDICQGYVHAGVDIFHQLFNFQIPQDIGVLLGAAMDIAYPLNIFWNNAGDFNTTRQQVISQAYQLLLCITTPSPLCYTQTGGLDIRYISTQFCNQYFAIDQPSYYVQGNMPWLGFPFPGLLQRNGSNVFALEARKQLSVQYLLNIVNQTVVNELPLKGIYIIGDVMTSSPQISIVLDALAGDVPRFYQPEADVEKALDAIRGSLQALGSGDTILIVGRYAESITAYNAENFISSFYPTPVFFLFSNILYKSDNFIATEDNRGLLSLEMRNFANSWQVMNMVDFINHLSFDEVYGADYRNEKYATQYLTLVSNAFSAVDMNETMQLLDSFSLKNVMINGVDFGGHINAVIQQAELDIDKLGGGYHEFAFEFNGQVEVRLNQFGAAASNLPKSYDIRTDPARKNFMPPATNQGSCNNCWVQSVVQAQKARFGIIGKSPTGGPAPISIAHVTGCSGDNVNGCESNHPMTALTFLWQQGAVDETCFPTTTIKCSGIFPCPEPICQKNCKTNYLEFKDATTNGAPFYKINGLEAFQAELVQNGPFASCFYVPTNFASFYNNPANKLKCYDDETAPVSFGHCVTALGYDEEYLYFRNSWGTSWANNGDFCVKANMQRVLKTKWFTNEAWAGKAGSVTTQTVTTFIPATTKTQPQNVLNPGSPISQVAPSARPTPKPHPRPSSSSHPMPSLFMIIMIMIIIIIIIN